LKIPNKNIVLVVDAGGRGAALIHAYSKSPQVKTLIAVPGNDLMQLNTKKKVITYPHLKTTSVKEIIEICKKKKVTFVDVAQDNAVEAGVTDAVLKEGITCIGPTRAAGQIEWDKAWARDLMKKYNIPHPAYKICTSEQEGLKFLKTQKEGKWFIKANGLAEGKGVIPAENNTQAVDAIKEMKRFGSAGSTYLIEQALIGEEFSLFALCDGKNYKLIGAAQDHKRMFNFDEGPNTGGMGCSSPPLLLTKKIIREIDKKIIKPTLDGLAKEKRPFSGILYLGGMMVKDKPYVIEFNARWGSPEAEAIIPGITSDFFKLNYAAAVGKLNNITPHIDKKSRVAVSLSLRPHPSSRPGRELYGIDHVKKMKDVILYGARITKKGKRYYAASGRLLFVIGEGVTIAEAREKAYGAISHLFLEGNNLHFRTDIGWRDMERLYT
jgi:phosphoribosylamine--glycine ligase